MRRYCHLRHGKRNGSLKLLITGASGLVGSKLVELALGAGHTVSSLHNEHPAKGSEVVRVDLKDAKKVRSILFNCTPDAVIHTASITDVDFCERNPSLAMNVNGKATGSIAAACRELNSFLVYVSTDYVFDGQSGLYREVDSPNPINAYGRSKLFGERMISKIAADYCIARTSVLFGCGREYHLNFGTWLLAQLAARRNVSVINGQFSSPTLNTHLARMLLEVTERRITGALHLAGADRINRYEFALKLVREFGFDTASIEPTAPDSVSWYARRPADSSLNVEKANRLLHTKPMTVDNELRAFKLEFQRGRAERSQLH
jgi:dTDP-4-dehydrorhamnose reductase